MKAWQWYAVAIFAGVVAFEALVYAAPTPNNCGLNMLCRIRTLIVSGNSAIGGDLGVAGDAGVVGKTTLGGAVVTGSTVNASAGIVTLGTTIQSGPAQLNGGYLSVGSLSYCDLRGAAAPVTCNKGMFCATIPTGTAGISVLNNLIAGPSGGALCTMGSLDATCTGLVAQMDAGVVAILPTGSCTAPADFCCRVITGP